MLRGPIYQEGYRPQLSGHETFPAQVRVAEEGVRCGQGN